jgi:hypothetical protein
MKRMLTISIVAIAFVFTVADAFALSGGGGSNRARGGNGDNYDSTTSHAAVPEPSTLYAVGAGLAFLGGAGWYIRRRK